MGDSAAADIDNSADDEAVEKSLAEPSPDVEGAAETTPAASAEHASAEGDDGARKPRRWIRFIMRWATVVVFVAVLAGAGYEGWLLFRQHEKDIAAAQALDAAQKYAVTLTSTDPNGIDQNVIDIINGATGDFKDRYTKASSRLRKMLIDNTVTTHGRVVDSAVKSATKNKVEVLLFVKQSVSNATVPEPHTDVTAVAITMEKVNGRWLASRVVPGEQG